MISQYRARPQAAAQGKAVSMLQTNHETSDLLEEYRRIVDKVYLVTQTDGAGRIVHANANFCKITGRLLAELIGLRLEPLCLPATAPSTFEGMRRTLAEGKCWNGIVKYRSGSGNTHVLDALVWPLREGSIGFYTDVTGLHEEQRQLLLRGGVSSRRAHDAELLASIPVPAAILDATSNVRLCNDAFAALFGVTGDAALNLEGRFIPREGYLGGDNLFDWKGNPFASRGEAMRALVAIDGEEKEFIINVKNLSGENRYLACMTLLA